MKNYYEILEVSPTASQEEIREQYLFLAQTWHPDKYRSDEHKKRAEEKFREIDESYRILSHPDKRTEYDRLINRSAAIVPPHTLSVSSIHNDDALMVVDIANSALEDLIRDLLNQNVHSSYERHLEKCLMDSCRRLFPDKLEEFLKLRPRIVEEIKILLSNNQGLKRFIERLELRNPVDENFDWLAELDAVVLLRRKQLGFVQMNDLNDVQESILPKGKIRWSDAETEQQPKSGWAIELEEMQERIRQRRRGKDRPND